MFQINFEWFGYSTSRCLNGHDVRTFCFSWNAYKWLDVFK